MAGNMKMAVFAALAVAALVINSASAVTYDVGDSLGWTIPPGGAVAYSTWANNHTFKDGDVLVFKFTTGQHDVAEVTKEAFDACNATGPISMTTTSPASLTLSAGEHYYICTFGGHCDNGQKLAVNVTGTSSPAPAPAATTPPPPKAASPTPVLAPEPSSATPPAPSAPAPSPSAGPTTHTVGDAAGWNVLPNGTYTLWAANQTFRVGDVLVFNFLNKTHNVAQVNKSNYDSCSSSNTLALHSDPPVRITLNATGVSYFICTFPGHCSSGQKLAVNVTGSTTSTPTSAPAPSPSATSPSPSTTATPPSTSAPPPGTGATPPSGTTTPSDATPPPANTPSSATSMTGVAGLSAAAFSVAVAFFMF